MVYVKYKLSAWSAWASDWELWFIARQHLILKTRFKGFVILAFCIHQHLVLVKLLSGSIQLKDRKSMYVHVHVLNFESGAGF